MPHVAGDDYRTSIETPPPASDWGVYVAPGNPFTVGQLYNRVDEPPIPRAAPLIFPTVRVDSPAASAGDSDSATPGPEALPPVVVDPEQGQATTVYEGVPGGIYETTRAETDWDAVYEQYVELNQPQVDDMAIDWGELAGSLIGGIFDPFGLGAATTQAFNPNTIVATPGLNAPVATSISPTGGVVQQGACGPTGPKYGKICLATGVITPLRRRRRRRLLTSSDIKDLSALKSIVGGAALQGAVVQAVRR